MKLKKEQLSGMNLHYQHYTLDYFLDSLKENGLQNFELWAGSPHLYTYDVTNQELKKIKNKIQERNLNLICLTPEAVIYPFNIAEIDKNIRDRSIKYIMRSLECAVELDTSMMLLTPGWGNLDKDKNEAMKVSLDSIIKITKRAEELGIILALEHLSPISSNLLNTSKDIKWALEQVNSPNLKGMLDTCQVCLANEHVKNYFEELGDKLIHIHIVDGIPGGHLAFGDGNIPLEEFVKTAEQYNYKGMFSMEISDRRYFFNPKEADLISMRQFYQWIK